MLTKMFQCQLLPCSHYHASDIVITTVNATAQSREDWLSVSPVSNCSRYETKWTTVYSATSGQATQAYGPIYMPNTQEN